MPGDCPNGLPRLLVPSVPTARGGSSTTATWSSRSACESPPSYGTVDILGPTEPPRGAFARVIPSGEGSEFLFTLSFPEGTEEAAVDAQMQTVEAELRTVRALSEAARA